MDINTIIVVGVIGFLLIFFVYALLYGPRRAERKGFETPRPEDGEIIDIRSQKRARLGWFNLARTGGVTMTRARLSALLVLSAILSLASIFTLYHTHQIPTEKERLITLCNYIHVGKNDYTANLKPNIIYNQSKLKPGDGIIYAKITESINTNFSYIFKLSGLNHPANITTDYSINLIYESSQWTKRFNIVPKSTRNSNGETAYLSADYLVNISRVQEMFEVIESETGTYTSEYNLTISPEIHTVAITDVGTIDEYFNPSMKIKFIYRAPEGEHIAIEGLYHKSPGTITRNFKIYQPWVMNQRYFSYVYSLITFSALAYIARMFTKTKPKKISKPLEETIEQFREIIFEIAEEPSHEGQRVTMRTLEDLVNLADGLAKPVFHSERPSHSQEKETTYAFYVLDGLVRYEYTITAPSIEEKAEPETVIEEEKQRLNE